jgi:hypothetical protein
MSVRLTRAQLSVAQLAGDHPLWVDRALAVPVGLLAVATEFAGDLGPLAICGEGRLTWAGAAWPLGRAFGRTVPGVRLVEDDGQGWVGTVVEVAADLHGTGLADTIGHELAHVRGIRNELEADRIGAMLARGAARWR